MEKAIRTLEFVKILERLAAHTLFSGGAALALQLRPAADVDEVNRMVEETSEARDLLSVRPETGVGGARDVRPAAARAARGAVLLPHELLDVRHTMAAAGRLRKKILQGEKQYRWLSSMAQGILECPDLIAAVDNALDDQGAVLDSASPKLARLRREIRIVRDRIQEKLQRLVSSQASQYLQEPIISQRAGRWVVPLQSNFKGRIRGLVHDQSASGATLWIEPLSTVEHNNEHRRLIMAEEEEVQRVLAELSAIVGDSDDRIQSTVESLAALDLAFAKAKYAFSLDAVQPSVIPFRSANGLHPGSTIQVFGARHPLLDPKRAVPIDVELDDQTYVVVITGPNTGGKTVSLKTVGLMVLMAQSGLHVPCAEATLSCFQAVYADIGDEQSIEQNLSTFSGHLVNVIEILKRADDRSLVVLDELGAGTDPSEGSALARSILTYLRDKGATTFVATHYPELKLYGHATAGVTNASVEFDVETLAPTFRLRIGLAGRSNAFEIAARLGLEPDIVRAARSLLSDTETRTEDLLGSIYQARDQAEAALVTARQVRLDADKERDALKRRLQEIDLERLRVLQDARIETQAEVAQFRDELRDLRQRLSAAGQPLTEIRRLEQQARELEQAAAPQLAPARVAPDSVGGADRRRLRVADTVWVTTLRVEGEILTLDGDQAEVQIGRLRTRAALDELEWRKSKTVSTPERELPLSSGSLGANARVELDVRGERVETALQRLEHFLDDAVLGNVPWVRIIHGKGTGALRTAVRQALKEHGQVNHFDDGKDGEGGWGVTVAYLG
jgi:DNA mismatch repair protein MutS2